MLESESKFVVKDENGEEKVYYKLFTFDSEETNKSYICYTDNSKDENGNVIVRANSYDPTGEDLKLLPLTSDKEWKVIESILASTQEKVKEELEKSKKNHESED